MGGGGGGELKQFFSVTLYNLKSVCVCVCVCVSVGGRGGAKALPASPPPRALKRKSFSGVGAGVWNELPTKLRVLPKKKFKKEIHMIHAQHFRI